AAALEQVGRWESSGVLVRGRAWADVGGGDGYYALALRLCGASRVILLDPSPPSAWAAPVLASAGVDVLTTDARCFDYSEIDSISFLYVPDVQVEELLQRSRRLEQLVTSEIDDADVVRETCKEHGWSLRRPATTGTFFTVGEPSAIPGASSSEELWLLSGPAGAQPRSFPSRGESYEGDANEEAADSDEAGKDSPQACR